MRKIKTVAGLKAHIKRNNEAEFSTFAACNYDANLAEEWFSWSGNYAYRSKSGVLVFVERGTELSGCPFLKED